MGTATEIKGVAFREMLPEDAEGVARVEEACFPMPWSREAFWKEAVNERTFYLVCTEGERIVGFAGCWVILDEAQVTNVAILKELRGKGYGRSLMLRLMEGARARGARAITLEVRPSNMRAIALYESLGFHEEGRRKGYYQDNGEDAILMWNTKLGEEVQD